MLQFKIFMTLSIWCSPEIIKCYVVLFSSRHFSKFSRRVKRCWIVKISELVWMKWGYKHILPLRKRSRNFRRKNWSLISFDYQSEWIFKEIKWDGYGEPCLLFPLNKTSHYFFKKTFQYISFLFTHSHCLQIVLSRPIDPRVAMFTKHFQLLADSLGRIEDWELKQFFLSSATNDIA